MPIEVIPKLGKLQPCRSKSETAVREQETVILLISEQNDVLSEFIGDLITSELGIEVYDYDWNPQEIKEEIQSFEPPIKVICILVFPSIVKRTLDSALDSASDQQMFQMLRSLYPRVPLIWAVEKKKQLPEYIGWTEPQVHSFATEIFIKPLPVFFGLMCTVTGLGPLGNWDIE
jgi:hypothetical protein